MKNTLPLRPEELLAFVDGFVSASLPNNLNELTRRLRSGEWLASEPQNGGKSALLTVEFETGVAGISGSWLGRRDEPFSLHLAVYENAPGDSEAMRANFAKIVTVFSDKFGVPSTEDLDGLSPKAVWTRGDKLVRAEGYGRNPKLTLIFIGIEGCEAGPQPSDHPAHDS